MVQFAFSNSIKQFGSVYKGKINSDHKIFSNLTPRYALKQNENHVHTKKPVCVNVYSEKLY